MKRVPKRACACCSREQANWMCADCRREHGMKVSVERDDRGIPLCPVFRAESKARTERIMALPAPVKVSREAQGRAARWAP